MALNEKLNTATDWVAVTPSDSDEIRPIPAALWVGVAGDVACVSGNGNTETFTVPAGLIPIQPSKVLATGTTATGIKALYNS